MCESIVPDEWGNEIDFEHRLSQAQDEIKDVA